MCIRDRPRILSYPFKTETRLRQADALSQHRQQQTRPAQSTLEPCSSSVRTWVGFERDSEHSIMINA
eukprot:1492910-Rhodomonas_salina.1